MNTANAGIGPATRNVKDAATAVAGGDTNAATDAGEASAGPEVGNRPTCRRPTTRLPG